VKSTCNDNSEPAARGFHTLGGSKTGKNIQLIRRFIRPCLILLCTFNINATDLDSLRMKSEADSLYQLADYLKYEKKFQAAILCARDALDRYRALSLRQQEAQTLLILGPALRNDIPDSSLATLQLALELFQDLGDRKGVGDATYQIGMTCDHQYENDLAREYYEMSLSIRRSLGDRWGECNVLNNLGISCTKLYDYDQALMYHEQALAIRKELGDRRGEGGSLTNIGLVYDRLNQYELSLEYYTQGLAASREVGNRSWEATALGNVGRIHFHLAQFDKALHCATQVLAIRKELEDRPGQGEALIMIGAAYQRISDYDQAKTYYEQSLAMLREFGNRRNEGSVLLNLGQVHERLSDYGLAMQCYNQVLSISREISNRHLEAAAFSSMGRLCRELSYYDRALEYYEQSLEICVELGDRNAEAGDLINIGLVYEDLAEYDLSLQYSQRGYEISVEIGNPLWESNALGLSGWAQVHLSDNVQATLTFERSLNIRQEIGDRYGECSSLIALGEVWDRRQDPELAEEYLRQARQLAESLNNPNVIASAAAALGSHYFQQGQDSLALKYYDEAVGTIETVHGELDVEAHQTGFLSSKIQTYRELAETQLRLGRKKDAFSTLERLRARSLLEILESGRVDFSQKMSDEERLQEKVLITHLEQANSRITELSGKEEALLDSLTTERAEIRLELETFEESLYLKYPELLELRGRAEPLELLRAQRIISADEAAVYYLLAEHDFPEDTPESIYTFVVTHDDLHVIQADLDLDDLESRVDRLMASDEYGLFISDETLLASFHEQLIAPILPYIKDKRRLCILPDGKLHYLPFQALIDADREKHLVEDFALYSVPSLSTLDWLRRMGTSGRRGILAFGNPVFDDSMKEEQEFALRGNLVSLPASKQEALALKKLYQPEARVFLQREASESNFKQHAGDHGVLHLATHALVNEISPLYSSIALTPDDDDDGFLEAWEIMRLKLNADIAVLSACETALGKIQEGEGMLGLTRAFFSAGVPSVVASLWKVEDRPTRVLMEYFHQQLRDGRRPADALREAQLHLLRETRYVHPRYWAPFILIGDSQ